MAKECFIYRTVEPERTTIEIEVRGSHLNLNQVQGYRNLEPSNATMASVEQWFDDWKTSKNKSVGLDKAA